jgi:hypothetical protein
MRIGFAGNLEKEGIAEYRSKLMQEANAAGKRASRSTAWKRSEALPMRRSCLS